MRTRRQAALAGLGLVIVLAVPLVARAQNGRFRLNHFTIEDGLAQNWVKSVAQDRTGFMWVGTSRGLQRFDGYSFVPMNVLDPRAPEGLGDVILKIAIDGADVPWIETDAGLFRYDRAARGFTRIQTDSALVPWALDSSGRAWLLDGASLKVLAPGEAIPRVHRTMTERLSGPMFTDGQVVWLGARRPGQIVRIDLASGESRNLSLRDITQPLAIVRDRRGGLWVSGTNGLEWLPSGGDAFVAMPAFRGRAIHDVEPDSRGSLLVLTEDALFRLSDGGQILDQWAPREVFETGLPQNVAEDGQGGIWLATVTAGLFRLDFRPGFEHLSSRSNPPLGIAGDFVLSLAERSDGSLWIGTLRNGAFHVSADGRRLQTLRRMPGRRGGLPSDDVWALQEDRAGNMWIATGSGLCQVRKQGLEPACYATPLAGLTVDATGQFWLARVDDVVSFDPTSGKFGTPIAASGQAFMVHADSGSLWIGGTALFRAPLSHGQLAGSFEQIAVKTRPNRRVYDFHRDEHGVLWLGSDAGLQRWQPERNGFEPVSLPDLNNVTVFSIEGDGHDRLWLGTSHGLVQFSPQRGLVRRFRREDGVLNAEFNRQASLRRRNGEMLFGGVDGITRFHPDSLTIDDPPPIVFTHWRKVTKNGLSDAALDGVHELRLNPGDRAFTIEFAALTYTSGMHRQYRFRLENMSDGWIESSDHVVTYATPPPGRYVFRVQASAGADGGWHEPGAAIDLVVVPAFWATAWFRILMAAAFVSALWVLHRLRLQRAVETERMRVQISRDLHDEIGAGLSSIALMSDSVRSTSRTESSQLDAIARTARDMVADLRDIVWAIDPDSDRLSDVVTRMRDTASALLRDVIITFQVNPQLDLSRAIGMTARRDLFLIYKELLHNVTRHSGARNVRIELQSTGHELRLVVADDGVGFSSGGLQSGTGLKSMRERASRLGGDLQLSSVPGKGTTATLSVRTT